MLWVRLQAGGSIWLPGLVLVGLGVGYVAGMFGVGGGFMLTPVLMHAFGVPAPIAVGSALSQTCGTSIASFLKYRHLRRGEPRVDLVMMGGSLMGVDAGTRLLSYLTRQAPLHLASGRTVPAVTVILDGLFCVLLSGISVFTFREAWHGRRLSGEEEDATAVNALIQRVRIPPYMNLPSVGLTGISIPLMAYLGFLLGLASGIMGIGGGVLFTPVLLYGFGFSARNAAGTGILLLFATAVLGTVEQAMHGYVAVKLSLAILVGSSIGSQLGALTTHRLPNRTLRMIFACLVGATALMILADLARRLSGS